MAEEAGYRGFHQCYRAAAAAANLLDTLKKEIIISICLFLKWDTAPPDDKNKSIWILWWVQMCRTGIVLPFEDNKWNGFFKCSINFDPSCFQLSVTNLCEGRSAQLLLYSDENIIYSTCSCLVMLTVFLKEVCRWKQLSHFHPFPSHLSVWEKYRSFLFDANAEVIPRSGS